MSRSLLVVAPAERRRELAPLLDAYARRGIAATWRPYRGAEPTEPELARAAVDQDAVLLIGRRSRAPRTVVTGPVLTVSDGRRVPVGWLPVVDGLSLGRFAAAAARLHARPQSTASVALLSQRHPRYLRIARRLGTILGDRPVFHWTADALVPEAMVAGLASGLGAAIYVGHGRPIGWTGYYGLRAHHFDDFRGEPVGAVLSLCCRTASRRRTGLSFAEALPLRGVCGAVFAAVGDTLHTDNTRWAVRLGDAMLAGARDLGELVLRALPPGSRQLAAYRIVGDPLTPLRAPASGSRRARAVEVHA